MGIMKRLASQRRSVTGNFSGIQGRFDIAFEVENKEVVEMLEKLKYNKLVKNKGIRKVFARIAKPVKKTIQKAAQSSMKSDPRKAYKGVRIITLKKGAGVVVGLLDPKNAGTMMITRKPKGGRSGIKRNRPRGRRTNQVDGYQGKDRSFILRMLNQCTEDRTAYVGNTTRYQGTPAGRGKLSAKKFFDRAEPDMREASRSLGTELGKIIEKTSKA